MKFLMLLRILLGEKIDIIEWSNMKINNHKVNSLFCWKEKKNFFEFKELKSSLFIVNNNGIRNKNINKKVLNKLEE